MRDVLGYALGTIDLRCPLGDAAVHPPVIDFLECLAVDACRCRPGRRRQSSAMRILHGRVDADSGVRRTGAARDERDAGPPGELAVGFGHVSRTAFLPADDEWQPLANIVQCVEHGEIAFAGNAERVCRALRQQVGDEDLAARIGMPWQGPGRGRRRFYATDQVPAL